MACVEMEFTTKLSPTGVVAALTDFSDRRPDVWPYLDRSQYRVLEVGETHALVREGTGKPFPVWAVERYDWSEPNVVRWTVQESDTFQAGLGLVVRVSPAPGGGSTVHLTWERVGLTPGGKIVVALIALMRGKPLAKTFQRVFDKLAG